MRPHLLKVSKGPGLSFSTRRDRVPHVNNHWHYHSEVELLYIKKGEGTQFIGDNIKRFKDGDIVLVGANLPHYWRFDEVYFEEGAKERPDVYVVHFNELFWGNQFLQLPENNNIRLLLEKAKRGIQVSCEQKQKIEEQIESLINDASTKRLSLLLDTLNTIADTKELTLLSSIGFQHDMLEEENVRINAIYEYSLKNFKRKIQLEEIAAMANISPNSFCRYFKSRTRKTYMQFLIEIRVGHACKLLIQNNLSIKQLCYESGFNNFTSFHKYFKRITGKSPLSYQKAFTAK